MKRDRRFFLRFLFSRDFLSMLFVFVKSGLLTFGLYAFSAFFIAAGAKHWTTEERNILASFLVSFAFSLSFYIFHIKRKNEEYDLNLSVSEGFFPIRELKKFFFDDGREILVVYGVLALLEIFVFLLFECTGINLMLGPVLFFVFPFFGPVIPNPLLGLLLSFFAIGSGILSFVLIGRWRIHQKRRGKK